jgi:hypothetical protein
MTTSKSSRPGSATAAGAEVRQRRITRADVRRLTMSDPEPCRDRGRTGRASLRSPRTRQSDVAAHRFDQPLPTGSTLPSPLQHPFTTCGQLCGQVAVDRGQNESNHKRPHSALGIPTTPDHLSTTAPRSTTCGNSHPSTQSTVLTAVAVVISRRALLLSNPGDERPGPAAVRSGEPPTTRKATASAAPECPTPVRIGMGSGRTVGRPPACVPGACVLPIARPAHHGSQTERIPTHRYDISA